MKWFFFVLLLINVGFFSYMQWGNQQSGESLEAHAPVNEAKIKVLTPMPGIPLTAKPGP